MSETTESFQIPIEAAEAYEAEFVPAFFAQWAPRLCQAAGLAPGQRVLDVACGTGVVARNAAGLVGEANVVGVDLNDAMLTVARRVQPDLEWHQGDVAALPFDDGAFDVALCQMALMFFADRPGALREMGRVTSADGTVAVLVPSALGRQAAYGPFIEMATGVAGPEARSLLSTYFVCGDADELTEYFGQAGLRVTNTLTQSGVARFPSIEAAVATEVKSTPLGERVTSDVYDQIVDWRPRGPGTVHEARRSTGSPVREPHRRRPPLSPEPPAMWCHSGI